MRIIKTPQGIDLFVNPLDHRGRALEQAEGNFNPHSVQLWNIVLNLLRWNTVLDVGSNFGEMLVWADIPAEAQIYAFEPNPDVLPYLRKTLHNFPRHVNLIEKVVTAKSTQTIEFALDKKWSGTSQISNEAINPSKGNNDSTRFEFMQLQATTIDRELEQLNVGNFVMKVDVEGFEEEVMSGATQTLNRATNWAVMLEILHMGVRQIRELSQQHPLFVLNIKQQRLVRVKTKTLCALRMLLNKPEIYAQDAVLFSTADISSASI